MDSQTDIRMRLMNDDERNGFLFALNAMETWSNQVEAGSLNNEDLREVMVPLDQQMANSARLARAMATSLKRMATP